MIWRKKYTLRVLAKGGLISPSYLSVILKIAKLAGNNSIHFGSRQDILFDVPTEKMPEVEEAFSTLKMDYFVHGEKRQNFQNIVSSYVACDIVASTPWLTSGHILHVLENFHNQPELRINITDPEQSMVPLFFGNLNFIASSIPHYWYLYIRRTFEETPVRWPVMILSADIAVISEVIQNFWEDFTQGNVVDWFEKIQHKSELNTRKIENDLKFDFKFPHDYEGFGKMYHSRNYWAGLYWRNNSYDIDFLEELCILCNNTGLVKICLTPWKSFLVKEIQEKDLILWNQLLGRFGITMRHSSFDLNWHLPFQDKIAFRLKRVIVKEFDKVDVCVHGLTFGIKTKPEFSFYSIKIVRKPILKFLKGFDIFATYQIFYAKDFNPNLCSYMEYAVQVPRYRVAEILKGLSLKFYMQMRNTTDTNTIKVYHQPTIKNKVYQCKHCLSIYDEKNGKTGDSAVISSFESLPSGFTCATCDGPKEDFRLVYLENILKSATS